MCYSKSEIQSTKYDCIFFLKVFNSTLCRDSRAMSRYKIYLTSSDFAFIYISSPVAMNYIFRSSVHFMTVLPLFVYLNCNVGKDYIAYRSVRKLH